MSVIRKAILKLLLIISEAISENLVRKFFIYSFVVNAIKMSIHISFSFLKNIENVFIDLHLDPKVERYPVYLLVRSDLIRHAVEVGFQCPINSTNLIFVLQSFLGCDGPSCFILEIAVASRFSEFWVVLKVMVVIAFMVILPFWL